MKKEKKQPGIYNDMKEELHLVLQKELQILVVKHDQINNKWLQRLYKILREQLIWCRIFDLMDRIDIFTLHIYDDFWKLISLDRNRYAAHKDVSWKATSANEIIIFIDPPPEDLYYETAKAQRLIDSQSCCYMPSCYTPYRRE